MLLLAPFSLPDRDCLAAALCLLARRAGKAAEIYYAAERGGGIFAAHGSAVVGGRHQGALAALLARRRVHVLRAAGCGWGAHLTRVAAARETALPVRLLPALRVIAAAAEMPLAGAALLLPEALPPGLPHGVVPYLLPELLARDALPLPAAIVQELGMAGEPAPVRADDTYASLSFRMVESHRSALRAIDICEPVAAAYRLPAAISDGRGLVCGEDFAATCARAAPLAATMPESCIWARYGGGVLPGARSDRDLESLARAGVSIQVIEPARPCFAAVPAARLAPPDSALPAPPDDDTLRAWASERRVLTCLATHSGELSHDDSLLPFYDLSCHYAIPFGIGVHWQRYAYDPDAVEPLLLPPEHGGVRGRCEPVLHSRGDGCIFEYLDQPARCAAAMARSRDRIAALVGAADAPRGVLCYGDGTPSTWQPNPDLWQAIADQGFTYVITCCAQGRNQVLWRNPSCIVINQGGSNCFPYSPFLRTVRPGELEDAENSLYGNGRPGWVLGVLDVPVYGDSAYLGAGDPYRSDHPRLDEFAAWLGKRPPWRGRQRTVAATPGLVARYARILDELGLCAGTPSKEHVP